MQYQELPNGPYKNATGAVVQSWMPEHWYSNQYLVGSQTTAGGAVASGGGGYGGRGFFDEQALTVRRQQQQHEQEEKADISSAAAPTPTLPAKLVGAEPEGAAETEFHFTSGGYQGSIGTPEAVRKRTSFFAPFMYKNDHFTKTGSGQT
jgi:hypothetical protein